MVSLEGSVGVPSVTIPISKPSVRVTKATDISDLTLEHIGQPQGGLPMDHFKILRYVRAMWSTLNIYPRTCVPQTLSSPPQA